MLKAGWYASHLCPLQLPFCTKIQLDPMQEERKEERKMDSRQMIARAF